MAAAVEAAEPGSGADLFKKFERLNMESDVFEETVARKDPADFCGRAALEFALWQLFKLDPAEKFHETQLMNLGPEALVNYRRYMKKTAEFYRDRYKRYVDNGLTEIAAKHLANVQHGSTSNEQKK